MCHAVLPGASHNGEMLIRAARAAEVPRLRDLDWDAGQIFRDIGMPEAAEFEPRTLDELAEASRLAACG